MVQEKKPRSTELFTGRADNYSQYRPTYPKELISSFETKIGTTPMDIIADIGSGTGILSKLFIENGNTVYGVEPNDEMRAVSAELLRAFPNFHAVKGTGEQTNLADGGVDLIVCGQSFHWFDANLAKAEFRRILKNEGYVALIWNNRTSSERGFNADYEEICRKFSQNYHSSGSTVMKKEILDSFFGSSFEIFSIGNHQELTMDGILGRYMSASYSIERKDPNYRNLLEEMETSFNKHQENGKVKLQYETKVYLGRV